MKAKSNPLAHSLRLALPLAIAATLSACDNDDNDRGAVVTPTPPPSQMTDDPVAVSGSVVKGVLSNVQVMAFGFADGAIMSDAFDSATTDDNGAYSLTIPGDYDGPLLMLVQTTSNSLMTCDAVSGCGMFTPRSAAELDLNNNLVIDFGEQFVASPSFELTALSNNVQPNININALTTAVTEQVLQDGLSRMIDDVRQRLTDNETLLLMRLGLSGSSTVSMPLIDVTDTNSSNLSNVSANLLTASHMNASFTTAAGSVALADFSQFIRDNLDNLFGSDNTFIGTLTTTAISTNEVFARRLEGEVSAELRAAINTSRNDLDAQFAATAPAADFTLRLFHAADQEAGAAAVDDAPRFSAVLNGLRAQSVNADATLTLTSGDVLIPGPFLNAASGNFGTPEQLDALNDLLVVPGVGRADILIQNALGFQAAALGNHEFDLGSNTVRSFINVDMAMSGDQYPGTQFPYLSANLDFTADMDLADLVVADGQAPMPNSIARSVVIENGGERFAVIGATTPTLGNISSPSANVVISPANSDDIEGLAAAIQSEVNNVLSANTDINKVILLAHMQRISIELQLAELLENVDIIVAGGSNTILADADDRLRAGDTPAGTYPLIRTAADGNPIAIVNTDGNYRYVAQLVVGFDENGVLLPAGINPRMNGVFATDDDGVQALADGNGQAPMADVTVAAVSQAIGDILETLQANQFGSSDVYLNGIRAEVRTEETNFGNLTADANLARAQEVDASATISIKNGGGIRAAIGLILTPPGSTDPADAVRTAPGPINQLDIQTSLAFNNSLTLVTVTAAELKMLLENGVSLSPEAAGRFPQVGGVRFSFDNTQPAGSRIQNLVVLDSNGAMEGGQADIVVQNGAVVGDASRTFRVVTLNFLANGGDGYPFDQLANANRVDLMSDDSGFTDPAGEQDALAQFARDNFSMTPFMMMDTPASQDIRIQNLQEVEMDTVLDGVSAP